MEIEDDRQGRPLQLEPNRRLMNRWRQTKSTSI